MTEPIKTEPSTPSTDLSTSQSSQATLPIPDQSSSVTTNAANPTTHADATPQTGTSDGQTPESAVDESYDLELSDDSPLSEEDLNEIAEEAGRLGLSKDDAVKLIAMKEKGYKTGESKVINEQQARLKKDFDTITKDEMFSGDNKVKSFESMSRAIETFGDDDMVALVKTAEFGNNVVLARFLKRLGDALAPDTDSLTGGRGSSVKSEGEGNSSLKNLYPSFFQDKK